MFEIATFLGGWIERRPGNRTEGASVCTKFGGALRHLHILFSVRRSIQPGSHPGYAIILYIGLLYNRYEVYIKHHYRFPPLRVRIPRVRRRTRLRRRRWLPSLRRDLRPGAAGRDPGGREAERILLLLLLLRLLLIAQLLELADFRELHRDSLVGLGPFRSGLILSPDVGPERRCERASEMRNRERGSSLPTLKAL